MFAAELVPVIQIGQLDGQDRGLNAVQAGIRPDHGMAVFRGTTMIPKQAQFACLLGIVCGHSACISIGTQVFARIETEACKPA